MKHIIVFITTIMMLTGCGVYNKYSRPEMQTENLMGDIATDTTTLASVSWKELFTDPHLQSLIETGLQNNTEMKITHLRVEQAEALLSSARMAYLPSLSLTPEGSISSFDRQKAVKTYNLAASASWEIDIFGKITNAKRQAQASLSETLAYRQAVQTNLVATIANTYYTLLMFDHQREISRETLRNWQETIRTLTTLKRSGQVNDIAIKQAEANKLTVEASLLSIEKQINEIKNSLSSLLGSTPFEIERDSLLNQDFPSELSVGIPLQLLGNRPDVAQAEYALQQAFYATNQARAAFYPSITLGGSAGWTNNAGEIIINPGKMLLSAVGSVVQPIFNKGVNRANLRIAKARQEEALLLFQQKLLDAGSEVNNALFQWQTARSRRQLNLQQIELLQSAERQTRLLMQHSEINYLEVLTTEKTLLDAQLAETVDIFDEIQGVINLYHALGGGKF